MKQSLSDMLARQQAIEARKPKPHARGEGIRAVKAWVKTQARLYQFFIDDKFAEELAAELQAAIEFEPMLGDAEFQATGGLV